MRQCVNSMEDAIIKLQEIVSHQQEELARLSEELYIQQREIAELRLLCRNLKTRLEQAEAALPAQGPEPPPPHY